MPRFVSNSSGNFYAGGRSSAQDEAAEEEAKLLATLGESQLNSQEQQTKKPSAINKKGARGQQKSSLELFKEELRRISEQPPQTSTFKPQNPPRHHAKTTESPTSRPPTSLNEAKLDRLDDLLRYLKPTKQGVGEAMLFCINNSPCALQIIERIHESLHLFDTTPSRKLARLYLISDILHNCSASVTNASFYRQGFQTRLLQLFEHLREFMLTIVDDLVGCESGTTDKSADHLNYKRERFRRGCLSVLAAWRKWKVYDEYLLFRCHNALLGLQQPEQREAWNQSEPVVAPGEYSSSSNSQENEADCDQTQDRVGAKRKRVSVDLGAEEESVKFRSSKWETVAPEEVAEQSITKSKWLAMAEEGEDDSEEDEEEEEEEAGQAQLASQVSHKRFQSAADSSTTDDSS